MVVPFNRPFLGKQESHYLQQVLESGHLRGDGRFTQQVQETLQKLIPVPRALLTTSCTDALEACGLLLNLEPGDEVIMPAYTFVSTANAFVLRGAKPRFVDIRSDTKNIDASLIETRISPRTKAIVVVHYAGVGCEMDEIMAIAKKHGLAVIEDNAHGLFGKYKGKALGSIGELGTLSFHDTKNFTSGEGGALLINQKKLIERAEIIREKGTNRSLFFRGEVDKYTWVDVGSSYLPSELSAALLLAQLERHEEVQAGRKKVWDYYDNALSPWAKARGIQVPVVPEYASQAYHNFYLVMPDEPIRAAFIAYMKERQITLSFHYTSLHKSKMGQHWDPEADCPITEKMADCLVRLPFYYGITDEQLKAVTTAALEFPFRNSRPT